MKCTTRRLNDTTVPPRLAQPAVLRPEDQGDLGTAAVRLGEELGAVHPDVPVLAGAHALAEEEPAAAQLLSVEDVIAEGHRDIY